MVVCLTSIYFYTTITLLKISITSFNNKIMDSTSCNVTWISCLTTKLFFLHLTYDISYMIRNTICFVITRRHFLLWSMVVFLLFQASIRFYFNITMYFGNKFLFALYFPWHDVHISLLLLIFVPSHFGLRASIYSAICSSIWRYSRTWVYI